MAIQLWRRPTWERSLWPDFDEFERAMSSIFGDLYSTHAEYPPVNIWTAADDIVVTAELPGLEPGDLDISIHERTLTFRCANKEREAAEGETRHRQECSHEGFTRSLRLPFEVDRDKVVAKLENGVLKLTLPRSEASKPRHVQVRTAQEGGEQ
ncbi:MAG: Hsp20/alpha crystallin family protein [Solirubrobacterales bacterium]